MVTVPMVSEFFNPLDEKAVEPDPPVNVVPYVLLASFAVIVKAAAFKVREPFE
jgi:hypothetical protein